MIDQLEILVFDDIDDKSVNIFKDLRKVNCRKLYINNLRPGKKSNIDHVENALKKIDFSLAK